MSTETRLRTALQEIAADGTPSPDLWQRLVRRRRTRRPWLVAAVAAASITVAVVGVAATRHTTLRPTTPHPTAEPPTPPNAVVATARVPDAHALALHGGTLWAAAGHDLVGIDPATAKVTARHRLEGEIGPLDVVAAGGALWTIDNGLLRVDPRTGRTLSRLPQYASDNDHGFAKDGDTVWALSDYGDLLRHFDARGRLLRTVHLPKQFPFGGVAVGHGAVWVNPGGGTGDHTDVARVDPATGHVAIVRIPYPGGNHQGNLAVTDDAVWFESGDSAVRVDPATGTVTATIALPDTVTVYDMAAVGSTVWIVGGQANTVFRIDSRTATITGSAYAPAPRAVVADATSVWVADDNGVERFDPALITAG
jgi:DNA-binding beta-propeller fold protein YncE